MEGVQQRKAVLRFEHPDGQDFSWPLVQPGGFFGLKHWFGFHGELNFGTTFFFLILFFFPGPVISTQVLAQ